MSVIGFLNILAWLCAVCGAVLSCALLTAEFFGKETPPGWWLKTHMWGRFVLMFLAGIFWLLFRDM